jgi:hypothetical protein
MQSPSKVVRAQKLVPEVQGERLEAKPRSQDLTFSDVQPKLFC